MLENAFDRKSAQSVNNRGEIGGKNQNGGTQNGVSGKPLPLKGNYGPPEIESVDIFRLLDQLEELPERAKHLPLLHNVLLGFDQEQFYYLVLKIRANLPDDMKKAQRVARDSERIVDEARDAAVQQLDAGRIEASKVIDDATAEANRLTESARADANRIIENARQQAASMIEQSEVVRMATSQANDILRRSETESSEIRKGADEYARDVLVNLEAVMGKAINTVQRGREALEKARV